MHRLLAKGSIVAVLASLLGAGIADASSVTAPDFVAGPAITPVGLLWQQPAAQMLTLAGRTRGLAAMATGALSAAGSRWVVTNLDGAVSAAPIGARPEPISVLRRCRPISEELPPPGSPSSHALLALSGSTLYAVVDARCMDRSVRTGHWLLAVDLRAGRWREVGVLSPGVAQIAAAGRYVAAMYVPKSVSPTVAEFTVAVLDASSGRRRYRTRMPLGERPRSVGLQLDNQGDVLATSTTFHPPAPISAGWWATPGAPRAHALSGLATAASVLGDPESPGIPKAAAAISNATIAYLTSGPNEGAREKRIELLDLHTDADRPLVEFPGELDLVGLDLGDGQVAWAQQPTVPEGRREGGTFSCTVKPLGPVELSTLGLRRTAESPEVVGPPLPAADQPPCTGFES